MPKKCVAASSVIDRELVMDREDIERYLEAWQAAGRTELSASNYRNALNALYDYLPEDKKLTRRVLEEWREDNLKKYLASTVNTMLTACNGFLAFMDCRELQFTKRVATGSTRGPELTRDEYRRMLSAAKLMDDEKVYVLVKTFAATGVEVQELSEITVEAVQAGKFTTSSRGIRHTIRIPPALAADLASFAASNHITSGCIFRQRNDTPMHRSTVDALLKSVSSTAQVDREKCNARALKYLFRTMKAEAEAEAGSFVERVLERQLEEEQLKFGWDA